MAADLTDLRAPRDRLLASPEFSATLSPGGIFLGDGEANGFASVLAVGPKVLDVKVGDRIAYAAGAGVQALVRGEKLLVLREGDVLAVEAAA
jgi:co-chaperonin GroES (HSP10)